MKEMLRQQIQEVQLAVCRVILKGIGRGGRGGRGAERNTVVVVASLVDVRSGRAICICDQSMSDNE